MALLITLAIIGGASALVALYILGTYMVAAIVGHTTLFKEKINAVLNDYRSRRRAKKLAKEDKNQVEETETQQ